MARVGRGSKTVSTLSSAEVRAITDVKQLEGLYKRAYKQTADRYRRAKQAGLEGVYEMEAGFRKPMSLTEVKKKVKELGYDFMTYAKNQLTAMYRALDKTEVSKLRKVRNDYAESIIDLFEFDSSEDAQELREQVYEDTGEVDFWESFRDFANAYENTVDGTGATTYQYLMYLLASEKRKLYEAIFSYTRKKPKSMSYEERHKLALKLWQNPFEVS